MPRQLDRRLHGRRDGQRLGQLRQDAAPELIRCHRRRADLHADMPAATEGRESATAASGILAPPGADGATICALSSVRAIPGARRARRVGGVGEESALPCSWHHRSDEGLLTVIRPIPRMGGEVQSNVPRPVAASLPADKKDSRLFCEKGDSLCAGSRRTAKQRRRIAIAISRRAIYSVDPTLRREFRPWRFASSPRPTTVTWLVDGTKVGTSSSERGLTWPLAIGAHEIEARTRRATGDDVRDREAERTWPEHSKCRRIDRAARRAGLMANTSTRRTQAG